LAAWSRLAWRFQYSLASTWRYCGHLIEGM
jgi:hypothetical protein